MGFSAASLGRTLRKAQANRSRRSKEELYPAGIQQAIDLIDEGGEELEPELVEAIRKRQALLDRARTDLQFRAEAYERCRKDPIYFFNNWLWTYDPRRTPSTIPFNLFESQEDFILWLRDRIKQKECGLGEKSRDMGFSYLCVGYAAWQFLFVAGSKVTFGSRKENLVDKLGDPDSLFEKLRQLLANLPLWLLPKSYSDGFLKFINRDNGATVTGESGDNMGRGGRSSLYFLDEWAFVARAKKVDAAVSNNSNTRIYISTPNGDGNDFAQKRFGGKLPVFRCHWLSDPRKNGWVLKDDEGNIIKEGNGEGAPKGAIYPWYEKQKNTLDPVILAQEVDIDYSAAKEGIVIPNAWILAAVGLKLPGVGDRIAGLDIADEGGNKNVLIIRKGPNVEHIESWSYGNTTNTAYKAKDVCEFKKVKRLNYDRIGVGAGVSGTLESCDELRFQLNPICGGDATTDEFYAMYNRKAEDLFRNLRAELWWNLRMRFEKTYEHVNRIKEYPASELISIPNDATLISQLSQPTYKYNDSGQIVVESKEAMKKRGIDSPDHADTLVYAFAPAIDVSDFEWMENA